MLLQVAIVKKFPLMLLISTCGTGTPDVPMVIRIETTKESFTVSTAKYTEVISFRFAGKSMIMKLSIFPISPRGAVIGNQYLVTNFPILYVVKSWYVGFTSYKLLDVFIF